MRDEPFPVAPARDFLGLLRLLYAVHRDRPGGERALQQVASIALDLRVALDLAGRCPVGSLGHAAAWERLDAVVRRAPDLVDCTTPLEPTLKVALARLRR